MECLVAGFPTSTSCLQILSEVRFKEVIQVLTQRLRNFQGSQQSFNNMKEA